MIRGQKVIHQTGVNIHALSIELDQVSNEIIKVTGTRDQLDTENKGSLVAAINEVNRKAQSAASEDLGALETQEKASLVAAINELVGKDRAINTKIEESVTELSELVTLETEEVAEELTGKIAEAKGEVTRDLTDKIATSKGEVVEELTGKITEAKGEVTRDLTDKIATSKGEVVEELTGKITDVAEELTGLVEEQGRQTEAVTGDLEALATQNKDSLVLAINELNTNLVKFMELLNAHIEEINEQPAIL